MANDTGDTVSSESASASVDVTTSNTGGATSGAADGIIIENGVTPSGGTAANDAAANDGAANDGTANEVVADDGAAEVKTSTDVGASTTTCKVDNVMSDANSSMSDEVSQLRMSR